MTARPSTFPLDGPAAPHIDTRIADSHLHLHGMAWLALPLAPAAILYFVSLDIFRHLYPSSLHLPTFSSCLYFFFIFCMLTIVFTTHTRFCPSVLASPVPLSTET